MIYIDARNLINLCVTNGILKTEGDYIIGKNKMGEQVQYSIDRLTMDLMEDTMKQTALLAELKKTGVEFSRFDTSIFDWD